MNNFLRPRTSSVFRTLVPIFVVILAFLLVGLISMQSTELASAPSETAKAYSTGGVYVYDDGDLEAVTRGKMFSGTGFEDGAGSGTYSNSSWAQYYNASSGGGTASGWTSKTGQMNSRYQSGSSGNKVVNVYVPKNAYGKYQYNAGSLGFGPCNRITMKIRNNYASASETISYYVGTIDTSGNYNAVHGSSSSYATIGYSSSTNMTSITIDFDNHRQNLKSIFIVVKGTSKDNYLYLDDIQPGWVFKSDATFTLGDSFSATLTPTTNEFYGTMYGNGKTLTLKSGVTSGSSTSGFGDNTNDGVLFGNFHGTIRDCTITWDEVTKLYNYTGSSTNYHNFAGIIAGKMTGGNIYGVTISIAAGKGFMALCADTSSSAGGGYGASIGAFAGQVESGTNKIYNCCLTLNGGVSCRAEDYGGNGDETSNSRSHVGGWIGEVNGGTLEVKSCEMGGTTGVVCAMTRDGTGAHKSNRAGGVIGVVRGSSTVTIDTFDMYWSGAVAYLRSDGASKISLGLLVGRKYTATLNVSNIAMNNNYQPQRIEVKTGSTTWPTQKSSLTVDVTHSTHALDTRLSNDEAIGAGSGTVTNSFCYMRNCLYLNYGNSPGFSTDYGEFKFDIKRSDDKSVHQGKWTVQVVPKSGYCASAARTGSWTNYWNASNYYSTYGSSQSAAAFDVTSSTTPADTENYRMYGCACKVSKTLYCAGGNKNYNGSGIQSYIYFDNNTAMKMNYGTSNYLYSTGGQGSNGTQVSTSGTTVTTNKGAGTYTIKLVSSNSASGSLVGNNTLIYVNGTTAPGYLGFYDGSTTWTKTISKVTLTATGSSHTVTYGDAKPSLSVTVTGFVNSETTSTAGGYSAPTASTTYAAGSAYNSSGYAVTVSGGSASNYTFSYVSGKITTNKRSITCKPDNKTINYGASAPSYTYSVTSGSIYGSDSLGTPSYSCSYTATAGNSNRNAGSYTISMSGLSNSNYTITQSGTGTLTVNKVALTIKADDKSVTYGGAAPSYTTTVSGFKYSETVSVLSGSSSASCSYAAGNAVGTQTITASNTYSAHTNYTFSNSNGTLTIGKKSVTITPSHAAISYGTATPTGDFSNNWTSVRYGSDSLSGTASYSTTYDSTNSSKRSAGSYNITMSGVSNSNYTITFGTGTLTVNKVALTIKADDKSVTYGNAAPTYTTTVTGFKYSETTSVLSGSSSATCSYAAGNAVGSQTITASNTYAAHTNYTFSNSNGTLTINKRSITCTPDNKTINYGDAAPTYSYSITSGSKYGSDSLGTASYTCSYTATAGNNNRNAGTYTISMSGLSNGNYTITQSGTGTLTVNKVALTIKADNKSVTYGGAAPSYTTTVTGFKYSETTSVLSGSSSATCSYAAGNAVGSQTITASNTYATHTNYTFTNSNGTLTIGKKSVTITPSHAAITYGAATPAQNTYSNNWTSVRYGSDTLTGTASYTCAYNGTAGNANRVVKSYDITMSGVSNDNYTISFGTGSLTVNKKAVTVTAANKSTTYGSAAPAFTVGYSGWEYSETTSVLTNSTVTYSCSYTATAGNANRVVKTYTITPVTTSLAADNYSFTPANGTLTVNKLEVTVTAANKSVTYGDAAPTYAFSYGSFVYSETSSVVSGSVTYSCTYGAGSAATNYTITPVVSGLSADNYSFKAVGGTLTVGKRSITCTPDNQTITYGDAAPTYTYSITSGEKYGTDSLGTASYTCSYDTSAAGTRTATTYTISMSGLSNSNYTITQSGTGTLTVNKFALTVKADNKSITYGAAAPGYTVTVSGYKFSETSSVLSGSGSASCTYAQGNAATTYTITASAGTLSATNYSFTTSDGTLTVNKKAVTITPSHAAITYGAATPAQSSYTNNWTSVRYGSDTLTGTATYTCAYNGTAGSDKRVVKSYDITMNGVSNDNYTITFGTGSLTVNKKSVTVTAVDKNATYGDAAPSYTVSYSGWVYSEDASVLTNSTVTYTCSYGQGNNATTYTITPVTTSLAAANYSFTPANGTLTVAKRTATLSWSNTSLTYNGSEQKPTCTVSNKYGSDTCNVTVSGEQTDAGDYTATASSLSNTTNYQLPAAKTQSFTIAQKAVTITAVAKSSTYGSAATALATPTVSPSGGFLARDSITLGNSMSTTISATTAVGSYPITPTATGTGIDNYDVTAVTANYTVNKKALTVTWSNTSREYTGSAQSPTYSITGFVNGHTTSSINASVSSHGPNVGSYTATLSTSGTYHNNYSYSSKSTSFSITAVTLTVTASSHTITYGDALPSYSVSYSGWVNSETVSVLTTAPTATCTYTRYGNQGNYDVTASGGVATNYSFSYVKGKLTVNKKQVGLSWSNTSLTYNGSSQAPTCSATGTVNSDSIGVTVTGGQTNAGDYSATASALTGTKAGNYKLPAANTQSFTINRAHVTVPTVTIFNNGSTTGTTITAGGTENKAYNGKAYSFSYTADTSKYTATGGSNITNYSADGSTLTLAVTSNYYWGSSGTDSENKTFKIMVTKVALTVTAAANSIIYGAAPAANGYSITGFVNSETASVVTGTVTYSYNYSQYGNVGSYTITPVTTGLSATNYSFTPAGGTLTVSQKEIGLSWGATKSWVYDGSSHAPTCSATGNVNSDSLGITVTPSAKTGSSLTDGAAKNVGSYTATASAITGTKAGNYKLPSSKTCDFSITRAYVAYPTVTIYNDGSTTSTNISAGGSQSKTYNNKAYTLNYSTPSGTSASATNSNTMTAVGSIVLTYTIDGNHYWKTSGGESSGTDTANKVYTLNVTAKSIAGATVTLGASYSYNGSSRTQSVSSVTIDGLTATFTTSGNVQTNAGNYELTVTGTGNFTGEQTKAWSIARAYVTVPTVTIYKGGATTGTNITAGTTEDVAYDGSEYTFHYTEATSKYTATGGSAITSKGNSTLTLNVTSNYYWGSSGSDATEKTFTIHVTTGGAVIVLAHASISYGTAKPTSGFTATLKAALAGGENLTGVTINQSDFNVTSYSAGSNKGSYTITLSGTSKSNIESRLSNYEVEYEGSLSVTARSLTLSWTDTSKVYTGLAQGPSVSISSGKYGSDDVTVSCNTPQTTVGSSTATATLGGTKKGNYSMSNGTTTFTVTKAPLTVTANANTITYGNAPSANGYTITGFVNSETDSVVSGTVTYTYNYSQYGAVGNSYKITPVVTGLSATNYSFSAATGTLTVSPKSATVTATDKSTTYGSAAPAFAYTTSGLVNGDTLSGTIAYACDYSATKGNANRVAGQYSITPSGLTNSNYSITFTAGTLTVNKKPVTVSWGTKTWTYDGGSHRPTATLGGTVYDESVTVSTYGGDSQVNVGNSYPVSVTAISNSSNYKLPTDGTAATTFSITAATLTVKADNKSVTYGAAVPTYTCTITGYQGSDGEAVITSGSVTYSCSYAQYSGVNTYTITPVVTSLVAANYNFSASAGTLTVSAKAATVTADNKTITYGEAKPSFSYTTSGLVNNDTLLGTISYSCAYTQTQGNANSVAKTYSITPGGLSNSNYSITFTTGTLTVNKKPVTLSWSASSYGYDGSGHLPTATVTAGSKGYAGDTVSVATYSGTTSAQTAVGNYTTTAATLGGTNGANYTLTGGTNVSKSWSITAKAITVTVDDVSITYGDAKPSFTYTVSGLVGEDTLSGTASYTTSYDTSAAGTRGVGDYDVTVSGLTNGNYSITFNKGTLSVTQKTVGLTWGALSFTYDTNTHRPVVSAVTGKVYSDSVAVNGYSGSSQTNVGSSYSVTATGLNNANYKLPTTASVITKTWSITPASVTVTWTNTSLPYNGNEQAPSVSITAGNLDGENLSVSTTAALTNVSSMTATAVLGGSKAGNYTISTGATATFEITALNISGATITLTTGSFTYDGTEKTVSISSITKSGLAVTYDYTSGRKGTNANTYTLTVTGNGNFTGTATKTWTIGKKSISGATITLASSSFPYDRTEKTVTISSVTKDALNVTYDVTSGNTGTDVDTYTLTVTGNGNFSGTATTTWNITAKEVQLTWSNTSRVYTGSAQSPSVALKSGYVISGDTVSVSTSASLTNVSSTTATATLGGANAGNYTIKTSDKTHSFEITPKTITFTITASNASYIAGVQGATVSFSGIVSGQKLNFTMRNTGEMVWTSHDDLAVNATRTTSGAGWSDGSTNATPYGGANVGSYGITITGLVTTATGNADNYQLGGTLTKTWSITPANVNVTANAHSITYGAAPANNGFTYGSFQGSDTSSVVSGGVSYSYSYTQYGDVGSYTITPNVSALNAGNYTFTAVAGTLTVNPLTATLSWSDTSLVYNGATQTPTCTVTNAVNGDVLGVTVTGGQKNVGASITATASAITGTKAGNYALPAAKTTTYSIAKTPLSVSANDFSIVYGTAAPTYTAAFDGFVGGETSAVLGGTPSFSCDYTATAGNANRAVGEYTITVSGYTSSNYDITFNDGTLSVSAKKLPAFTWGTSEWTYDGASHRSTVSTINGKCYSDTVTIAGYDLAAQTAAGQYTISVTGLSGADAANYAMPDVPSKTFEIKKANVSISVTSYTGLTYTAASQTVFSVTVSGIQNSETLGFVYTGISGSPLTRGNGTQTFTKTAAGTYTINFTSITDGTGDADNYNLTSVASGTTIINKATLSWASENYSAYNTVTWSAPTGAVGGDTLTYSYSVKKSGTEKLGSSSATTFTPAETGTFVLAVTVGGTNAANYNALASKTLRNVYSVTFQDNDSEHTETPTVLSSVTRYVFSEKKAPAPNWSVTEYEFKGWKNAGVLFDVENTNITANLTLTASWKIFSWDNVTFKLTTSATPSSVSDYTVSFTLDSVRRSLDLDEVPALGFKKSGWFNAITWCRGDVTCATNACSTVEEIGADNVTMYGKLSLSLKTYDLDGSGAFSAADATLLRKYLVDAEGYGIIGLESVEAMYNCAKADGTYDAKNTYCLLALLPLDGEDEYSTNHVYKMLSALDNLNLSISISGITWDAVDRATGYKISVNGGAWSSQEGRTLALNTVAGTYTVQIKAYNATSESAVAEITYTTVAVALSNITVSGVTATWTATALTTSKKLDSAAYAVTTDTSYTFTSSGTHTLYVKAEGGFDSSTNTYYYGSDITKSGSCTITKLTAPTLSANTSGVGWDAVSNATGYQYSTNGGDSWTSLSTSTRQINYATFITTAGEHTILVRAVGNGSTYLMSDNSDAFEYTTRAISFDDLSRANDSLSVFWGSGEAVIHNETMTVTVTKNGSAYASDEYSNYPGGYYYYTLPDEVGTYKITVSASSGWNKNRKEYYYTASTITKEGTYTVSTLGTPTINTPSAGATTISWTSVTNATGYEYSTNGGTSWTSTTARSVNMSSTEGTHTLVVRATSSDPTKLTSNNSNTFTYVSTSVSVSEITFNGTRATWVAKGRYVQVKEGSGSYTTTTLNYYDLTSLSAGSHTVYVKAFRGYDASKNIYYSGSDTEKNASKTIALANTTIDFEDQTQNKVYSVANGGTGAANWTQQYWNSGSEGWVTTSNQMNSRASDTSRVVNFSTSTTKGRFTYSTGSSLGLANTFSVEIGNYYTSYDIWYKIMLIDTNGNYHYLAGATNKFVQFHSTGTNNSNKVFTTVSYTGFDPIEVQEIKFEVYGNTNSTSTYCYFYVDNIKLSYVAPDLGTNASYSKGNFTVTDGGATTQTLNTAGAANSMSFKLSNASTSTAAYTDVTLYNGDYMVATGRYMLPASASNYEYQLLFNRWKITKFTVTANNANITISNISFSNSNDYVVADHDEYRVASTSGSTSILLMGEEVKSSATINYNLTAIKQLQKYASDVSPLFASIVNVKQIISATYSQSIDVMSNSGSSATYGTLTIKYIVSGTNTITTSTITVKKKDSASLNEATRDAYSRNLWKEISIDPHEVILAGSSSMEKWERVGQDMKGITFADVGIGGTVSTDWSKSGGLAERLIYAYNPRAVILFVGVNDLKGGSSVSATETNVQALLTQIHNKLPNAKVYYVLINKVPLAIGGTSGNLNLDNITAFNSEMVNYATTRNWLTTIALDTEYHMVYGSQWAYDFSWSDSDNAYHKNINYNGNNNYGKTSFFDSMHLNQAGYTEWAYAIRKKFLSLDGKTWADDS